MEMEFLLRFCLVIIGFYLGAYLFVYIIRLAWSNAENRTRKVCDFCFRDIKKFNEAIKNNTPKV